MFSVDVVFSAKDDLMNDPQWWEYTIVSDVPGLEIIRREDCSEWFAGQKAMFDFATINETYWKSRQLMLF